MMNPIFINDEYLRRYATDSATNMQSDSNIRLIKSHNCTIFNNFIYFYSNVNQYFQIESLLL